MDAVRDVAIEDGRIAAVAQGIAPSRALKTVDASGLYVTPGLIDIQVHGYPGDKVGEYVGGGWSIDPDSFTERSCVTTVAHAGSSGWRNFEEFKHRIIDQSKTRIVAFLKILGAGMGSGLWRGGGCGEGRGPGSDSCGEGRVGRGSDSGSSANHRRGRGRLLIVPKSS